ncbi:S-adenosyl-L-methionine-dependent methyltransferase [Syncephalis fuscata]|nr:S-adenosyl-L-methionine-dependent methyltransferase [Syncephalis fuscata]
MDADAYSRRQYTPTQHNALSTTSLNGQNGEQSRSKSLDLPPNAAEDVTRGRTTKRIRRKRSKSKSLQRPVHQYIMGRRYHNVQSAPYCLPNDAEESDRYATQHYILRALFGKNYLAPIDRPAYALDIGCGTGTWQMEMAADFPTTEFIGIDISPIQPSTCIPVNCHFEIANMLDPLPFADQRFGYVHQRLTSFGVPEDSLDLLLGEHARICSPGGWLELLETDWEPRDGGEGAALWSEYLQQLCIKRGSNPRAIFELVPSIEDAGFTDVRRLMVQLPLGSWGGMIGTQARKIIFNAWEALRGPMLENEIATTEEFDRVLLMLDTELDERPMWLCLIVYLGKREMP